jgi:hypothetical protein
MLTGKHLCLLGVLIVLMWGCCGSDLLTDDEIRGQDIRPYVGLIRNFSAVDISIPSHDSNATLILPSQGQLEYTVWKPNVDISGYVDGRQVYFKNIRIEPAKKYTYFGKSYDFLAEICPDLHAPAILPRECPPPCPVEPEPKPKLKVRTPKRVCPG